jgi:hypothetical protein
VPGAPVAQSPRVLLDLVERARRGDVARAPPCGAAPSPVSGPAPLCRVFLVFSTVRLFFYSQTDFKSATLKYAPHVREAKRDLACKLVYILSTSATNTVARRAAVNSRGRTNYNILYLPTMCSTCNTTTRLVLTAEFTTNSVCVTLPTKKPSRGPAIPHYSRITPAVRLFVT